MEEELKMKKVEAYQVHGLLVQCSEIERYNNEAAILEDRVEENVWIKTGKYEFEFPEVLCGLTLNIEDLEQMIELLKSKNK